jgi:hypothetical protein
MVEFNVHAPDDKEQSESMLLVHLLLRQAGALHRGVS